MLLLQIGTFIMVNGLVDIIAAFFMILFCVSHSFFASNRAKSIIPISQQYYRLFFNVIGGSSLIILTIILIPLASSPDNIIMNPIITPTPTISLIATILAILGIIFVAGSILQTNPLKFAGLLAEEPDKDLQTGFFYRFARHPMYTGAILWLGPNIFLSGNMIWLLQNVIFVAYFIIGSLFEERRLRGELPGYDIMFTRGALFPWKKQHFISLFKNPKITNS